MLTGVAAWGSCPELAQALPCSLEVGSALFKWALAIRGSSPQFVLVPCLSPLSAQSLETEPGSPCCNDIPYI